MVMTMVVSIMVYLRRKRTSMRYTRGRGMVGTRRNWTLLSIVGTPPATAMAVVMDIAMVKPRQLTETTTNTNTNNTNIRQIRHNKLRFS